MPGTSDFLRRNKIKLATVGGLLVVILALTLYSTTSAGGSDEELVRVILQEDIDPADVQEQIKAANRTSGNSTLIFASVIFRHGDRNPTNPYKTDPYADGSDYVGGWGALTTKGKRRMYLLGKQIRKRYTALIPPLYLPEDIYVLSSDADRCIMSVECLLVALYPPLPFQKIHPGLDWQPIPVHTVPRDLDRVVSAKSVCPKYSEALNCVYNGSYSALINSNHSQLLTMLTEKSGEPIKNYAQAESLYNTLALQKELGLQLPHWASEQVLQSMKQLAIDSLAAFTHTKFMQKIKGGPLLSEIQDRMQKKKSGDSRLKLFMVSGHDLTLINLLRTLGFTNDLWKPNFSASLLVELHRIEKNDIVQLWYNNGFEENANFERLQIPGCDLDCTLEAFLEVTRDVIPTTWNQDCTTGPSDNESRTRPEVEVQVENTMFPNLPSTADFLRGNKIKLATVGILLVVILVLTIYWTTLEKQVRFILLDDYSADVQEQINAANRTTGNSTVIFASLIFRHGDRNPTNSYNTDPYADGSDYIGGIGALTLKGKRRMYLLGKHIRNRYTSLIPPLYLPEDIYVLSSEADRSIMSVECLLAALHPPLPFQKIHPGLDWQPIPVHMVPFRHDKVVIAKNLCPKYSEALSCVYNSSYSTHINSNHSQLLTMLTEKSGGPIRNYAQAEFLYNILILQKELGLPLPEWASDQVLQSMKQLAINSLAAFTHTKFMQKIKGGPLLSEIQDRMQKKKSGEGRLKLFMVSGHDLTLVNLLRALGFTDDPWKPNFSASLLVELHRIEKNYIVQLWYNNGFEENANFERLQIPGCDLDCTLEAFLEVTKDVVPTTWDQDCTTGPSDREACLNI
ncbi:uncharacterized protein LOC132205771 [Neocloeon triangulifer]|uniref:uncharacterized protein LOC132205771 n=1 Tax=Neocloeon triangulifer TaxID=2078957 RepID=UPI00286F71DC|nr:uncharacterized protein LOC132205771 [Neocloeon triangulifer]